MTQRPIIELTPQDKARKIIDRYASDKRVDYAWMTQELAKIIGEENATNEVAALRANTGMTLGEFRNNVNRFIEE